MGKSNDDYTDFRPLHGIEEELDIYHLENVVKFYDPGVRNEN